MRRALKSQNRLPQSADVSTPLSIDRERRVIGKKQVRRFIAAASDIYDGKAADLMPYDRVLP